MAKTSINVRACNIGSAERHNLRSKELDYIRPELTNRNEQWVERSIPEVHQDIAEKYKAATGQGLLITTDSEGTEHINKTTRQWSFYDPAFNTIYFGNKHYWDIDRLNKEQFSFYDRSGEFGEIGMSREYVTLKPYAK